MQCQCQTLLDSAISPTISDDSIITTDVTTQSELHTMLEIDGAVTTHVAMRSIIDAEVA